jgi:lipopolysaccharide transport system ATP-binding protein
MNQNTLIKVESVSKKFCRNLKRSIFYGAIDILKCMLNIPCDTERLRKTEFWSLDNISFELKQGEILGLIGFNGSGKSTMLRIINGIFPPDKGKVTINGRIGALIAVGAGFHPHMTGRENIYLNGTILGMTKSEIKEKFDSIVDFSEIGDFLDAPVSTYSSGMFVRLGFSIAIHGEPDIMLVDEILAVGDARFQKKCLTKIKELKEKGTSFILVSHNMQNIEGFATKAILFHNGKKLFEGDTKEAISQYELLSITNIYKTETISIDSDQGLKLVKKFSGFGTDEIRIIYVKLLDNVGNHKTVFNSEDLLTFEIKIRTDLDLKMLRFYMSFINSDEIVCLGFDQEITPIKGEILLKFPLNAVQLSTGEYRVSLRFYEDTIDLPLTHGQYGYFTIKKKKAVLIPGTNTPLCWIEPEIITSKMSDI